MVNIYNESCSIFYVNFAQNNCNHSKMKIDVYHINEYTKNIYIG